MKTIAEKSPALFTAKIAAVAGIITGRVLSKEKGEDFAAQHELSEVLIGHPLWTHEFAEQALWEQLRQAALSQHPELENLPAFDEVACERAKSNGDVFDYLGPFVEQCRRACGETLAFKRGSNVRTEHPIETFHRLAPGKPLIVMEMIGLRQNTEKHRCPECNAFRMHDELTGSPRRFMCAECAHVFEVPK